MDQHTMLIAGGTGSIGSVIARQATAAGWRVAVHGRSDASVAASIAALPAGSAEGFAVDIAAPDAAGRLIAAVGQWAGRLDAVIDCTAAGPKARIAGLFADTEPDGYGAFLDLSAGHVQRLAHAALPWLARQGGTFIAFASDAGLFAAPRQTLVGASRAAVMGFIRNLATEVARDGVRAHCLSPSFVEDTRVADQLAATRPERMERARAKAGLGLPTPEDIAPLVLFLCGDGARRITGQVISINGGLNA
jgi:3-oxoacyl-[acyl-carrier protein] reductase